MFMTALGHAGVLLAAATFFAAGSTHAQATVVVSVPIAKPTGATKLSQSLIGFSIESDRWPEWTGIETPNTFWINTLKNLEARTGKPPRFASDRTTYVATQKEPTLGTFPEWTATTPYPEALNNTVGPAFWLVSKHLPAGTRMHWGVNFGFNDSAEAIRQGKAIVESFKSPVLRSKGIILELIEAGNEPDLYRTNNLRSTNYSVPEYISEWSALAGDVTEALGLKKGSLPGWLGASFSGKTAFSPTELREAYDDGLIDSTAGKLITAISQHRYSGSFCTGGDVILTDLMDKSYVRGNISVWKPDIEATLARGLKYWLGETNSYSCHGAPGVSNAAAAAIWLIDYTLQAAVQKIEEVFYHHGIGFKYNFMQPVALNRSIATGQPEETKPAHVQPSYYGAIAITEAIGRTGRATVAEIVADDAHIAGYAIYEGQKLVRAIFLNAEAWTASSTGTRPSVRLQLAFGAKGAPTKAIAKRLVIERADDLSGVTWGGLSFETPLGLPSGGVKTELVELSDGLLISATEAVLLSFV
ncbi:hypothetical protein BKA62DRAFT_781574 [Auriculariales sp. MPI-PUGE-AT-0066]|nr:hypothetical protein BKA62DRAFT_781574 [Auriculariales sp. MPI-PUGE-AT-0066]